VQFFAEHAHNDVAGAAGAHRDNRLDRPRRIVLRLRRPYDEQQRHELLQHQPQYGGDQTLPSWRFLTGVSFRTN